MFAILIKSENVPKIRESGLSDDLLVAMVIALTSRKNWYAVTGYIKRNGEFIGSTVLPAFVIEEHFEYDPDKIKTDWDQIVRK